jgi:2'-5' RNA ligase
VSPRGRARGAGRRHPRPAPEPPPPAKKAERPQSEPQHRLFVALDLPDDALAALQRWQELVFGDLPELRINPALHLTLCFLGDTPASAVPALSEALAAVPFRRSALAFGDPFFLPERGRKNVIALPLVDAATEPGGLAAVRRLQAAVGAALVATGLYKAERRPFLPHVTVARFRRPGQPFSLHIVNLPELCPSRLVLYTSVLDKAGAVHTPLAEFTPR